MDSSAFSVGLRAGARYLWRGRRSVRLRASVDGAFNGKALVQRLVDAQQAGSIGSQKLVNGRMIVVSGKNSKMAPQYTALMAMAPRLRGK